MTALFHRWADFIEPLPSPVWALVVLFTSLFPFAVFGAILFTII